MALSLKKVTALLLVWILFGIAAFVPEIILHRHTQVDFLYPTYILYEQQVHATGEIVAGNSWSFYLDVPVVASSVHVALGDSVQSGELLAELDPLTNQTDLLEESIPAALRNNESLQKHGISQETLEKYGNFTAESEREKAVENPITPEQIVAPMDGIVTAINLKEQLPNSLSQPAVTISDPNSFEAVVQVGEAEIAQIQVGNPVEIQGAGFGGRVYNGVVQSISPVAYQDVLSNQEAVVDVNIAISNPDEHLKEGFTVQAEISAGEKRPMLTVPYGAVQQDENNVEYVYLVEGSRTVRRDIVTGMELTHSVEVTDGLTQWDIVVSDASQITGSGTRVLLKGVGS